MIVLLGETAAIREIDTILKSLHWPTVRADVRESMVYIRRGQDEYVDRMPLIVFVNWLSNQTCSAVVEASHPSCSQSFGPIRFWAIEQGVPYVRLERPVTKVPESPLVNLAANWEEAIDALEQIVEDNRRIRQRSFTVFVTTGSHQLESLVKAPFARDIRWVVRVLPEGRLVQKCQDLGIPPKDIVAMQGPFSKELNRILFKSYGADVLLTRDSGPAGGTDTKISAALALGINIILLKRSRPETEPTVQKVHSVAQVSTWLRKVMEKAVG